MCYSHYISVGEFGQGWSGLGLGGREEGERKGGGGGPHVPLGETAAVTQHLAGLLRSFSVPCCTAVLLYCAVFH